MRPQKTFIMTHSLGRTNPLFVKELDDFDRQINDWIGENVQPDTEVIRTISTTVAPKGTSGIDDGQFGTLVITLIIEYTPRTDAKS